MEGVPWDNLFQYGFSVLAFLILFFSPTIIDTEQPSNLENIELIDYQNRTYADAENLTVTVSGTTSVTSEESEIFINSTTYDKEQGLLEVQLAENSTELQNFSRQDLKTRNYSVNASFSQNLPEQVIISGVMGQPEAFSPR